MTVNYPRWAQSLPTSSIPYSILITVKKVLKELVRRRSNESGTATLPEFMHPLCQIRVLEREHCS